MNIKRALLHTVLVFVTAGILTACGQNSEENKVEDTLSNAGETVEQTIDNVSEALNDAGDATHGTMTDAGNILDSACEEVKEGVDAANTDC